MGSFAMLASVVGVRDERGSGRDVALSGCCELTIVLHLRAHATSPACVLKRSGRL